jgi:hypothetical protein
MMPRHCFWHCFSIAVGIALALPVARAADILPEDSMPPITRCVIDLMRVDGLPVVQHGYCFWDEDRRRWVPLSTSLARHRVFGIRPIEE